MTPLMIAIGFLAGAALIGGTLYLSFRGDPKKSRMPVPLDQWNRFQDDPGHYSSYNG